MNGRRAAVLQMTAGVDPAANTAVLIDAVKRAAGDGAAMLFTPEMSGMLDRNRERAGRHLAIETDDRVLDAVRGAAAEAGIWVHLGSLAIRREDGRLANRGYVIDGEGAIRARYDKLHLFDVDLPTGERWRESECYAAGERAVVVDTPLGTLGLAICYDLRFPALFTALAAAGATILAVPAAFTRPTGAAHWHTLLRARAIENAAFVIAAAQTGEHEDGRATWGHSLVIDPWGEVLVDMGDAVGVTPVAIDASRVAAARARVPVLDHARVIPQVVRA